MVMQLLDFKLWRNYLVKKSLLLVAIAFVLQIAGCSSHNLGADDNQNINNNSLIIEPASIVPVIDGKATAAGVYVHNYSNETLENITYEATITDSARANLNVAPHQCASIAANSSCLLMFYTPTLTQQYDSGSTLLTAHFNGYKSKQIINYSYIASKNYSGVSFNGDLTIPGTGKYGTVYAFGGQQASFRNVGFYPENSSIGIVNGLDNGHVNIGSNEVIPLEIKAAENITAAQVSLTPYLEDEINFKQLSSEEELSNIIHSQQTQKSLQAGNIQDITIIPEFRANLVIGAVPTLNAEKESNAIVTIANNGVTAASDLNLAVLPGESAITVSVSDVTNPCSNSLAAGASCNFRVNLLNNNSSGSTSVIVTYNNGISTDSSSANVSYYNSAKAPMVSAKFNDSSLRLRPNTPSQAKISIENKGSAELTSPKYSLLYTGNLSSGLNPSTIDTGNCGSTIPINANNCNLSVTIATNGVQSLNGNMLLQIAGSYAGQNYSFISKPISVKSASPEISSYSPVGNNVSTSTNITLNFSESMDPLTLNTSNIHLLKSSESKEVALTSLGVSNNNQTVSFKLASGALSENTKYDIFYNGKAILNSSGVAMDSSDNNKYLGSFTTSDFTNPTITAYSPVNGALLQSLQVPVCMTFSEALVTDKLNSNNLYLKISSGTTVSGTSVKWESATNTACINHSQLQPTTTYKLVVNQTQLQDTSSSHNPVGNNTAFVVTQFTTSTTVTPTVINTTPVNGSNNVTTLPTIALTFSQPMDKTTLNNQNIILRQKSGSNIVLNAPTFSSSTKVPNLIDQVSFTVTRELAPNSAYELIIAKPQAIKDISGNPMGGGTVEKIIATFSTSAGLQSKFMLINDNSIYSLDWASMNNSLNGLTPISRMANDYSNITRDGNGRFMSISNTHDGNMITTSTDGNVWDRNTKLPRDIAAVATNSSVKIFCINSPNINNYAHTCLMIKNSQIWRSTDDGNTWSLLSINSITYARDFACNGSGTYCALVGRKIVNNIGSDELWLSLDNGLSWQLSASLSPSSDGLAVFHPYSVAFIPFSATLLVGGYVIEASCKSGCPSYTSGAIYKAEMGGAKNNSALQNLTFYRATIDPAQTVPSKAGGIDDSVAFQSIGCMGSFTSYSVQKLPNYCWAATNVKNGYYTTFDGGNKFSIYSNAPIGIYVKKIVCGTKVIAPNIKDENYCFIYALDDDKYEYIIKSIQEEIYRAFSYHKSNSKTDNPLRDIAVFDSNSVLGVGANGRIAKAGGGFTDIVSPSPAPSGSTLQMVCAATNCVRSYYISNNYQLQYSSNNGMNWTNSTGIPASTILNKLFAINKSTFLAVTNDKIYRTNNNGSSWSSVLSSLNANSGVSCTGNTCYVVTSNQASQVSFDGGSTWSSISGSSDFPANGTNNLYCWGTVCFNANSGGTSEIYRSGDNLKTWQRVTLPTSAYITNISCSVSTNHPGGYCLALGDSLDNKSVVMKSVDSGLTWSQIIFSDNDSQYYDSLICASNYCVLAASNGVPKFSIDSGATWGYLWAPISLYSQNIIAVSN